MERCSFFLQRRGYLKAALRGRYHQLSFSSPLVISRSFSLLSHPFPFSSSSLCHNSQQRNQSTFVSKHYQVDSNELKGVLDDMETRYRRTSDGYELQVCNFCDKGNKNKESNQWKLKVNGDGSYHCFRCSIHGTWFDLKKQVSSGSCKGEGGLMIQTSSSGGSSSYNDQSEPSGLQREAVIPDQEVMNSHAQRLQVKTDPNAKLAMEYLTQTRKLSKPTILK
jgi:hypothetical protein